MGKFDIHLEKLDVLCDLLDQRLVFGNIINHRIPSGEPYIEIWKGPYSRRMESDFCESDILFKIFWLPLSEKYSLRVFDTIGDKKIKSPGLSVYEITDTYTNYFFKSPNLLVDIIKEALISDEEKTNMNKDQKRGEAISNLIKELTSRKIYWTSMGVVRGYPTLRIYDKYGQERIADIYVMGTNTDIYVYAIDPLTSKFREQLKNNKYNCVYTEPRTDGWYVYLTPSTTACVIKDFLEMPSPVQNAYAYAETDVLATKALYDYRNYSIVDVIFNDPATIVIWADGSKTVVKANGEKFDPEKGLAMAISKKVLGNKHDYYELFKKHIGRYRKKQNWKR